MFNSTIKASRVALPIPKSLKESKVMYIDKELEFLYLAFWGCHVSGQ